MRTHQANGGRSSTGRLTTLGGRADLRQRCFACVFVALLINQTVAEPTLNALGMSASKDVIEAWVQSRARREVAESFSSRAQTFLENARDRVSEFFSGIASASSSMGIMLPVMVVGAGLILAFLAPDLSARFAESLSPIFEPFRILFKKLGLSGAVEILEPEIVGRSLQPSQLLDRGLNALDIKGVDCRRRMSCEFGAYTMEKQPIIARFLDLFSNTVGRLFPTYSEPLVDGIRGVICSERYGSCPKSFFSRITSP